MPGSNNGTGQPLTLRCAKCKVGTKRTDSKRGMNLEATGRWRSMPHRAIRQATRRIEYHCLDCGHTGWSQHIDAERLLRRLDRSSQNC